MGKRKLSNSSSQTAGKSKTKRARTTEGISESKNKMSVAQLIKKVEQTFLKNADPKNAVMMKKYMRDKFEHLGIKSPVRKSISKEFLKVELDHAETREFVKSLWDMPQREFQHLGIDYLDKNIKAFGDSVEELESNFECIKYLVTCKSWWDTVDAIASHVVSYLVKKHPSKGKPLMEEWINHDNMWLRRTALLHQLPYKLDTDEDMLYRFCIARADEEEFFIRKAMGWALRQYAHTKPTSVKSFLKKNKKSLSKLTYKEAAKHLGI